MPHSPVKTAGLKALATGAVLGAGTVAAAPHFAAGMRKSFRPHLEAVARRNQLGPLGTMGDLGPDQFKFAHTELPMRAPVPDEVYVAAAHGHLSQNEVAHLESFAGELSKGASFTQGLQYGLGTAAASAVGGLAMMGLSHGIQSTYDSMTFEKDLQATLKTRPELSTYPKEQVRLVYSSLRRLSPEIAKDPLTAGTYLIRQFERRNPSDPHSLPTVELESARTLTQITGELGKRRDSVRDALLQANMQGVQAGVGYMQDARQAQRQSEMEDRKIKGSFGLEAEKARLRDHYTVAAEGRRAEKENTNQLHAAAMQNLKDQRDAMHAAHGAQVGGLEQKLQEMKNRANAAEGHLTRMEERAGADIRNILRGPTTAAAMSLPRSPMDPSLRRAMTTRPPGPRRGKN